ncbi:protein containg methyltransferase domain [Longilinea arvoryzae]|uniref:Protein containg methyltransferase domain n=1 Tax=Longilinea arvoryzae TaxID=360412 RepID=A0A0K8MXW4_9CHLR|nr:class I SAM-dependent methyltransferase [Longilinea arvoryzae]GAP16050.1 protein containg methyltransferase domain [Longilinea arvoryzae]
MENKGMQANRRMWDAWAQVNLHSAMYNHADFLHGRNTLHALELAELGSVQGQSLLHLQCHFGHDTFSWARLGASVTGMDFSPEAIKIAQQTGVDLNLPARFICCNLYDLPQHLAETFDVVFTSYGVLTWLPDVREWARIAARYVRPGGVFYMAEYHPFSMVFDDEGQRVEQRYPYFNEGAIVLPVDGTYADRAADVHGETYEWSYPLGEVISALIDAGLRIQFVHEFPYTNYPAFPWLEQRADGNYYPQPGIPSLPLTFSIKAVKPLGEGNE